MKLVRVVPCPKEALEAPNIEDIPKERCLVRDCMICNFYCGETDTRVHCSYPSLYLKIGYEDKLYYRGENPFEEEAIEITVSTKGREGGE